MPARGSASWPRVSRRNAAHAAWSRVGGLGENGVAGAIVRSPQIGEFCIMRGRPRRITLGIEGNGQGHTWLDGAAHASYRAAPADTRHTSTRKAPTVIRYGRASLRLVLLAAVALPALIGDRAAASSPVPASPLPAVVPPLLPHPPAVPDRRIFTRAA